MEFLNYWKAGCLQIKRTSGTLARARMKTKHIFFLAFILTALLSGCKKDKMDKLITRSGGWAVDKLLINNADSSIFYTGNPFYCQKFYFSIADNHEHIFEYSNCDSSNYGQSGDWSFSDDCKQLRFSISEHDYRYIYAPIGTLVFWDIPEQKLAPQTCGKRRTHYRRR